MCAALRVDVEQGTSCDEGFFNCASALKGVHSIPSLSLLSFVSQCYTLRYWVQSISYLATRKYTVLLGCWAHLPDSNAIAHSPRKMEKYRAGEFQVVLRDWCSHKTDA